MILNEITQFESRYPASFITPKAAGSIACCFSSVFVDLLLICFYLSPNRWAKK